MRALRDHAPHLHSARAGTAPGAPATTLQSSALHPSYVAHVCMCIAGEHSLRRHRHQLTSPSPSSRASPNTDMAGGGRSASARSTLVDRCRLCARRGSVSGAGRKRRSGVPHHARQPGASCSSCCCYRGGTGVGVTICRLPTATTTSAAAATTTSSSTTAAGGVRLRGARRRACLRDDRCLARIRCLGHGESHRMHSKPKLLPPFHHKLVACRLE